MRITVIGTGYVGLVTGASLAYLGHQAVCVDVNEEKIKLLKSGVMPLWEPGLESMIRDVELQGRLDYSTDVSASVPVSDAVFLTLGTPSSESGEVDLSALWSVVRSIAPMLHRDTLLIIKSTVPAGTCEQIEAYLHQQFPASASIAVAHNPEFLRQGSAVRDFLAPDRLVFGASRPEAHHRLEEIYAAIQSPVIKCGLREAELIKCASNAFLAMKISYANMMSDLCDALGISVDAVAEGMGLDRRIGSEFLRAGAGYGGSCFPKDLRALIALAAKEHLDMELLKATEAINRQRVQVICRRLEGIFGSLEDKQITIYGLAFKPNTDDTREAPALRISSMLQEAGARIRAYDPVVAGLPDRQVDVDTDMYEAADGSDCVVIVTDWDQFNRLDWGRLRQVMRSPYIFDARNMLDIAVMTENCKRYGLHYMSLGRPSIAPDVPLTID
ncbi:UDP-glucose dehydrogenase family protein [Paenibacillus apis]|uniref:UDP-glucose 6-dehydrogenase n=1 Tax=Paenibacillus apis TaxID=1792174 RepID=A0A919Y8Q6_9BACL|nr:UDP-glucose/GDP-mannose dehydrogenase family protein [Paenibacillus apis]GIO44400.1 UDP-glucose 6-dehydrogenase [Paenibacillus apis]